MKTSRIVELIAANYAKGVTLPHAHGQSFAFEIQMRRGCIYVRDLGYIKVETSQDDLCVRYESARAQFGAWIMLLFEDQDSGREMRGYPFEM